MKQAILTALIFFIVLTSRPAAAAPETGFYIPDYLKEVSVCYRSIDNLIILPVIINDSIEVNLILDTGCRNVVLFGKQFSNLFHAEQNRKVTFSGPGSGKPVEGSLSLGNKISFGDIVGNRMPVILVPERGLLSQMKNVHGVIGYDLFIRFEVELNFARQKVTFRPGETASLAGTFQSLPFTVSDTRPLISSRVMLSDNEEIFDLLIDTGSTLGLLITTKDQNKIDWSKKTAVGKGLNGIIIGNDVIAKSLKLGKVEIIEVPASITYSRIHAYASVGVGILKDYTIVLNYSKGYAGIRREIDS